MHKRLVRTEFVILLLIKFINENVTILICLVISVSTNIQTDWLKKVYAGEILKKDDPHNWSVYIKRIRKTIDQRLDNLRWIALNMPEILEDSEYEIEEFGKLKRRRLKTLMLITQLIYPEGDIELVKLRNKTNWPPLPLSRPVS